MNNSDQVAVYPKDDGAGGDSCDHTSGLTSLGVGGGPCALVVSSGAGGDASQNDIDDIPMMKVFRDRTIQEDHRESDRNRDAHPRSDKDSQGSSGSRLQWTKLRDMKSVWSMTPFERPRSLAERRCTSGECFRNVSKSTASSHPTKGSTTESCVLRVHSSRIRTRKSLCSGIRRRRLR